MSLHSIPQRNRTSVQTDSSHDTLIDFNMMKEAFFTLRSISHPLRKKILNLLEKEGRITVTEIYIRLRIEQSVASQHLSVLRSAGVVKTKRDGKFVHYYLNKQRIAEIASHVEGLTRQPF